MSEGEWKLVDNYDLEDYPNGIVAGTSVRIKRDIVCRDHKGRTTGKRYPRGEVWTVLSGIADEPDVIWLRQADGKRHTWSSDDFFDTFELIS